MIPPTVSFTEDIPCVVFLFHVPIAYGLPHMHKHLQDGIKGSPPGSDPSLDQLIYQLLIKNKNFLKKLKRNSSMPGAEKKLN